MSNDSVTNYNTYTTYVPCNPYIVQMYTTDDLQGLSKNLDFNSKDILKKKNEILKLVGMNKVLPLRTHLIDEAK